MEHHLTILIVEDNPVNLKLAKDLLEMEGYAVQACSDAETALQVLDDVLPDVVLMDIALPGMDGLELTRILRAQERTQQLSIIALTAFAMPSDKQRVHDAGCDGYITKPIDTRTFVQQILAILGRDNNATHSVG